VPGEGERCVDVGLCRPQRLQAVDLDQAAAVIEAAYLADRCGAPTYVGWVRFVPALALLVRCVGSGRVELQFQMPGESPGRTFNLPARVLGHRIGTGSEAGVQFLRERQDAVLLRG
jgi:hypothetical protein